MSRRVLVTGGSRGIGFACARHLAGEGWQVLLAARDAGRLRDALDGLPGDDHTAIELDVADASAWRAVASRLAPLDGVVHAAATLGPIGPIGSIDERAFAETLQTNVVGLVHAVQATLLALQESGGGFVAFSGGGATGPLPRFDAYAVSKAATVKLVENLAADGVRINAVAPGFVATQIHEDTLAAGPEAVGADYFARTQRELASGGTDPQVAAELVAWLLSDDSTGVAGRLISAPWDPWSEPAFQTQLRTDDAFGRLRRIDNQFFAATDNK